MTIAYFQFVANTRSLKNYCWKTELPIPLHSVVSTMLQQDVTKHVYSKKKSSTLKLAMPLVN